ncbi:hypothetical protein AB3S75_036097 [Citrus x aurantiifolia]
MQNFACATLLYWLLLALNPYIKGSKTNARPKKKVGLKSDFWVSSLRVPLFNFVKLARKNHFEALGPVNSIAPNTQKVNIYFICHIKHKHHRMCYS